MRYPQGLQNLIERLSELPSVGPKTAERYAFYLLRQRPEKLKALADSISGLPERIIVCASCQGIAEASPCPICADSKRANGVLCVVENSQDLAALEATGQFGGQYFVLGGLIDTVNDVRPENLNLEKLLAKVKSGAVKEMILALNFTLEGETTALYLNKLLKDKIKITRLAKGLPAGSDLEYADETTLASALRYRSEIK